MTLAEVPKDKAFVLVGEEASRLYFKNERGEVRRIFRRGSGEFNTYHCRRDPALKDTSRQAQMVTLEGQMVIPAN